LQAADLGDAAVLHAQPFQLTLGVREFARWDFAAQADNIADLFEQGDVRAHFRGLIQVFRDGDRAGGRLNFAERLHQFALGQQIQAFFVDIVSLHLVFQVVAQFFALTPAFDAGVLQVVKGFVEIIQRYLIAEDARSALGFTVGFAGFGGQRDGGDVAGAQELLGFRVVLFCPRPTGFHLHDFFIKRDGSLVVALIKEFLGFVHHPFCFRVVAGLEELAQGVNTGVALQVQAVGCGFWREWLGGNGSHRSCRSFFLRGFCRAGCPPSAFPPDFAQEAVGFINIVQVHLIRDAMRGQGFQIS